MSKKLLIGKWVLDIDGGTIHYRDSPNKQRKLTKKLLQFITVLYEENGQVLDKKLIVERVWDGKTSSENITQTVNKLRGIFEDHKKDLIVNHPGKGYSLNFSVIDESDIEPQSHSPKVTGDNTPANGNTIMPVKLRLVAAVFVTMSCLTYSGLKVINGFQPAPIHNLKVSEFDTLKGCHLDATNKVLSCE
ncbi:winged helix-turn-helix domain-containing protein [Vibrio owensii]|uniref:winged helix-turn-helix domain-containing protein n=1 Tax=Vibrio owensii TaxID=696485 RepID=UPI003AB004C1